MMGGLVVWGQGNGGHWERLEPVGFEDEAALHSLVEENPALLPLLGSPQLVVLGREVSLGPGSADLVAVEASGRLVVVEVKLARNSEARRAIVAQVLSYAAFLHGATQAEFTATVLPHLHKRGFSSIEDACQGLVADFSTFATAFDESLATGRFRLVLVLDSAPPDLVRLVGYLDSMAEHLTIDLIQVSAYRLGDHRVLVPQRVEAADVEASRPGGPPAAVGRQSTEYFRGPDLFDEQVEPHDGAAAQERDRLRAWGDRLAEEGVARLESSRGPVYAALLVRLIDENVGPVAVYNDGRTIQLGVYRSVLERRSPRALLSVEDAARPTAISQGTTLRPTDALLDALSEAYREAAGRYTADDQG